jgi:hypothetical protein
MARGCEWRLCWLLLAGCCGGRKPRGTDLDFTLMTEVEERRLLGGGGGGGPAAAGR